jgi:hypothetical protein
VTALAAIAGETVRDTVLLGQPLDLAKELGTFDVVMVAQLCANVKRRLNAPYAPTYLRLPFCFRRF